MLYLLGHHFTKPLSRDRVTYARVTAVGPGGITADIEGQTYGPGVASIDADLQVGDQVPQGFLLPGSSRQPVLLGRRPALREFPLNFLESGGLHRLTGLWTQWEGGPGLSMQPGLSGRQWIPVTTGLNVCNQFPFEGNLNDPQLWSSPVLWPTPEGMRLALLVVTPQSSAPGDTLQLWLQIWGEFGESAPYMFLLHSLSLANYYAPLGVHGIALNGYDSSFAWGGEHMPSKLHYLPTTQELLILGPGWDATGRIQAFLCKASDGSLVNTSVLGGLNWGATVGARSIVTAQWDNTKAVGAFTGTLTESNPGFGSCSIIGYRRNTATGIYGVAWSKNPFEFVAGGAGIQILKPVSPKPSGRNDRRWPYSTKTNTVGLAIAYGNGIDRSGGEEHYQYIAPGSPGDDIKLTYVWAGAQTGCYEGTGITFAILDAETGLEKFRHNIHNDGYTNRQVEGACFGTGPGTGLPAIGSITNAPGIYDEIIYQGFEDTDRIDYHCCGDMPILFPLSTYNANNNSLGVSHGGTWTLLRENNGVGINYRTALEATSQWVVIGTLPGGPILPSPLSGVGQPGAAQSHNSPGGTCDTDGSYYFCYAMPWLITMFAQTPNPIGGAFILNIEQFEFPPDSGNLWTRSHSFSTGGSVQRFRSYIIKFQKTATGYTVVGPVDISQYQSGIVVNNTGGLTPIVLEHAQPRLEQIWSDWLPVISKQGEKIQNLLFAIRDIKDALSVESRPMLEVRSADTLALLGQIEIAPLDIATAGDANSEIHEYTTAQEGHFLYECRAKGAPRIRVDICNTVPGQYGQGCAAVTIWLYYQDRRENAPENPAPPGVTERVVSLLFNGAYPAVAPTITTIEQADYLASENLNLPRGVDTWAKTQDGAYYREGNIYRSEA